MLLIPHWGHLLAATESKVDIYGTVVAIIYNYAQA